MEASDYFYFGCSTARGAAIKAIVSWKDDDPVLGSGEGQVRKKAARGRLQSASVVARRMPRINIDKKSVPGSFTDIDGG
jgi:hypothetical protein